MSDAKVLESTVEDNELMQLRDDIKAMMLEDYRASADFDKETMFKNMADAFVDDAYSFVLLKYVMDRKKANG